MLLLTRKEQAHQMAHMQKFHADLEYKEKCMDEPMNIL